mmetsp:Transcript_17825/g.59719  ORF Transcript_17825/g.59719 Transcript_17825/m.59719 type:complete len:227 (-) Transcript_17825:180-860(-)
MCFFNLEVSWGMASAFDPTPPAFSLPLLPSDVRSAWVSAASVRSCQPWSSSEDTSGDRWARSASAFSSSRSKRRAMSMQTSCVAQERAPAAEACSACAASMRSARSISCACVPVTMRSRLAMGAGFLSLKRTRSRFWTARNWAARCSRSAATAATALRAARWASMRSKNSWRGRGSLNCTATPGREARRRDTSSRATSQRASKEADWMRYRPAFLDRRMATSGPQA